MTCLNHGLFTPLQPPRKEQPFPYCCKQLPDTGQGYDGTKLQGMDTRNKQTPPAVTTVLFDFDGVVVDTEAQYSSFWHQVGIDYLQTDELEIQIREPHSPTSTTGFFKNRPQDQKAITAALDDFEQQMEYDYVPGLQEFASDLRRHSIQTAVRNKFKQQKDGSRFSETARNRKHVRPHPHGRVVYTLQASPRLLSAGKHTLGATPQETCIFEDSFNGLRAAVDSGASVIGLATTNSRESIAPFCQLVLDNSSASTTTHCSEHTGKHSATSIRLNPKERGTDTRQRPSCHKQT